MATLRERFDHPAWVTVAATAAGYGLILLCMTVALFLLPVWLF